MTNSNRLLDYLPRLAGRKIAVVGDLYHDEYISGKPSRISREAPVVVLEYRGRKVVPGGATSPACNVVALGSTAFMLGVIGPDQSGQELQEAVAARGVDVSGLVVDPNRPTTTKTRIVAEGDHIYPQQVARIDHADRTPISGKVEQAALDFLERIAPQVDAILFSDYKCGVVNERLIQAAREATRRGQLVTVDSQGDLTKFAGCSLIKCNQQEAERFLRRDLESEADFETAMRALQEELSVGSVVITRGSDGISTLDQSGHYAYTPVTYPSEVFDVTGAGDAVIAVLTLALVAGVPLNDAAHLANSAGQVVIRKLGNVSINTAELQQELEKYSA